MLFYNMVELKKEKYHILLHHLKKVPFNILFAQAVIEQKVSGKVFVDKTEHPTCSYILHPYGMSLLIGDTNNDDFNRQFIAYTLNA